MILFLLKFSGNSNVSCLISRETETGGSLRDGYSCSKIVFTLVAPSG